MKLSRKSLSVSAICLALACSPDEANAWVIKGKWSTAKFNCQGTEVEVGVDMKSRIGGGDAAPVRTAYLAIGGQKYESVWIVGASMNTVSTNNRDYDLVLGNRSLYLKAIGRKNRSCVNLQ